MNGQQFEIVGVMKRPAASFPGQDDRRILLPYFTMQQDVPECEGEHAGGGRQSRAAARPRSTKRGRCCARSGTCRRSKPDNFSISTSEQMVEQFHSVTSMVALVMVVLSSIGLLVGGIGVMNIMLVSVTERTREIGIRKAIGARRIGYRAAVPDRSGGADRAGRIARHDAWAGPSRCCAGSIFPSLPTSVPLWAAVLGVVVSVAVGLFFGIWPANKAARLDPVVALAVRVGLAQVVSRENRRGWCGAPWRARPVRPAVGWPPVETP